MKSEKPLVAYSATDAGLVQPGLPPMSPMFKPPRMQARCWPSLKQDYSRSFLVTLGLQYFNMSMGGIAFLSATYLWREEYSENAELYRTFAFLPWLCKFLYALFSDILPLCGSRKRSYITLMTAVQGCALGAACYPFSNGLWLCVCLAVATMASAWVDVCVNGLMLE